MDRPYDEEASSTEKSSPQLPSRPTSIKRLNQALAKRQIPELVEGDIEEQFVRGNSDVTRFRKSSI